MDSFLAVRQENELVFEVCDFTQEHIQHMLLKHMVSEQLRNAFEAEGNTFVWENLMAESFSD
jgi:hypothetical protein